jgi:hypothetical protein
MSDQDDLFAGTTEPVVTAKYEDLVGDDKRYKTNDDAAKALVEKDLYIKRLEAENAEARAAAVKRNNEDEFLKKLEEVTLRTKSPEQQDPPVRRDEPAQAAITPESIDKLLDDREAERTRKANLATVTNRLTELYGDDYRSRVQSPAKALGVGTDFLTEAAAKNPQAFYRLMGLDQAKRDEFTPPPRSSMNTSATPSTAGKKDYAYYNRLRAEKGEGWYFSLPVQQEIWRNAREAEARGEKFLP